ncbi:MAG: 4Fe-4S binding protein [Oscillospiraceae bacterium]
MKKNKYLFLITLAYFVLGYVTIHFALLGLICMALPSIFLFRDKKKTWCQDYCPRASLYTTCGNIKKKHSYKTPKFFIKGSMKWIMLGYFGISLMIIILSTIGVAHGKPPMDYLRFLLIFPLKGMPQLFDIASPEWVLHLSYRFYSMMMTTTTLGLILALIFKPRTWCTICPIATVSDIYIKRQRNKM